jgi:hypothetical protein
MLAPGVNSIDAGTSEAVIVKPSGATRWECMIPSRSLSSGAAYGRTTVQRLLPLGIGVSPVLNS